MRAFISYICDRSPLRKSFMQTKTDALTKLFELQPHKNDHTKTFSMKKIAYLFALGLTLTACSGNKQQMMGADNNEFAVETVETGAADLSTTYPATIRGVQDVEIRAKVSGNIVRQLVAEGDIVKAGQV